MLAPVPPQPSAILHLVRGLPARALDSLERLPEEGFIWLDFSRDAAQGWEEWPRRLLNVEPDRRHVIDSHEASRHSFFDTAPDYDLLIFEGLGSDGAAPLETHSAALFVFDRLLVTVRAADSVSFRTLRQRLGDARIKSPANPRVLAQIALDIMVGRFLAVREAFSARMDELQESLLDPRNPSKDWQGLLAGRRDARRLEALCEDQIDALDTWRRESRREWPNPEATRLRDVREYVTRVRDASADLERHIEAAVQLYFAAMTYRTSEIMRTLTIFSVIFLPLTFLAGIYGMNFEFMPELRAHYAYPIVLGVMAVVAIGLVAYFRRRGYF